MATMEHTNSTPLPIPDWLAEAGGIEEHAERINRMSHVDRQALATAIIGHVGRGDGLSQLSATNYGAYLFASYFDPSADPSVLTDLAEDGWYIHNPVAETIEAVIQIGRQLADKRRAIDQVAAMFGHLAAQRGGPPAESVAAAKAKLAEAIESPDVDRFVEVIGYYPTADSDGLAEVEDSTNARPAGDEGDDE